MLCHSLLLAFLSAATLVLADDPKYPDGGDDVVTNAPTTSSGQKLQMREEGNDYVWFDLKQGGGMEGAKQNKVGYRLKDDDSSVVIHHYNASIPTISYTGNLGLFSMGTILSTDFSKIQPNAAPSKKRSTWNSTNLPWKDGPKFTQDIQCSSECFHSNITWSLKLLYENGTTETRDNNTVASTGAAWLQTSLGSDIRSVNVSASNKTYHHDLGIIFYDGAAKPWKVKYGAGPNLPSVSGTQSVEVFWCPSSG